MAVETKRIRERKPREFVAVRQNDDGRAVVDGGVWRWYAGWWILYSTGEGEVGHPTYIQEVVPSDEALAEEYEDI